MGGGGGGGGGGGREEGEGEGAGMCVGVRAGVSISKIVPCEANWIDYLKMYFNTVPLN